MNYITLHFYAQLITGLSAVLVAAGTLATMVLDAKIKNQDAEANARSQVIINKPLIDIKFEDLDVFGLNQSGRPNLKISLQNIGNSPLYVEHAFFQIRIKDLPVPPQPLEFDHNMHSFISSEVAVIPMARITSLCISDFSLLVGDAEKLRGRQKLVYINGSIIYRNPRGDRWQRGFVRFWRVDPAQKIEIPIEPDLNFEKPLTN